MECFQVNRLLSDHADGLLDPETERRVEEHLSVCKACSAEFSALQTFIRDIGSMEKMRAPSGFLQNVHARIEQESLLKRILGKLFYPFHIKIPLEAAGIIAAVLLVVSIQQRMLPFQKKEVASPVAQAPSPGRPMQEDPAGLAFKEESKQLGSDQSKTPAEQVPGEAKPVVIALLLKPTGESDKKIESQASRDPSSAKSPAPEVNGEGRERATRSPQPAPAPRTGMSEVPGSGTGLPGKRQKEKPDESHLAGESQSTHEFGSRTFEKDKAVRKEESLKSRQELSAQRLHRHEAVPPYRFDAAAKIRKYILDSGGTVLSVDYEKKENQPSSITAIIPAEKYASLLEKLRLIGDLVEPPPPAVAVKGKGTVQVKIELKPSR